MNKIFTRVLIPGILSTAVVVPFAILFEGFLGFRPHAYLFWHRAAFVYYAYLMPAFCLGSLLAAWCSHRNGGNVRERLVSGMFYAIASFLAIVLPLPLALVIDRNIPWQPKLETLAGYLLSQVIVPGIPMLLGTLPFLFVKDKDEQDHRPAAA